GVQTAGRNHQQAGTFAWQCTAAVRAEGLAMASIGHPVSRHLVFAGKPGHLGGGAEQVRAMCRARALAASAAVTEEEAVEVAFDFEAHLPTETGACMFAHFTFLDTRLREITFAP